jgi:hypothetical protein
LAAYLVVTHRQMQRYERDLKRIGAARLHARAQTVGVPIAYLHVGPDEAAAKRPIGPHERLVLSTVRSVDAEHSAPNIHWGKGCNEDGTLKSADGFRALYKGEGMPPIARRLRVAASARARATPDSS